MKKSVILRIFVYLLGLFLVVIVGLIGYVKIALPSVGNAPELKVVSTQDRIERGRYLANAVTVCVDCHSTRDWTRFSAPLVAGTIGKGGELFDQRYGFPGAYYSKNITPKGIGRYTDGELFRVITTGVTKEGKALFPLMPYSHYGTMDTSDIVSIIAYLRTLNPIDNKVSESVSDFPMNIIINIIPQKAVPQKKPDTAMHLEYGAYMVNACGCVECHTKDDKGQIIPALAFMGGREFKMPGGGIVRSSNITPDEETGIGNWTEEAFVNRFKSYADSNYAAPLVAKGAMNTVMPWTRYGQMTRSDLAAIYTYLRSLPAKKNDVKKFVANF